jgi:hypothetical protein
MSSVAVSAAFVLAWQEIILAFIRYQHIFQVSPPLSHTKLTMHVFFEIINSLGGAPGSKFQIWGQAPVRPESDSRNRTRAAALTAERLATGPTARSHEAPC